MASPLPAHTGYAFPGMSNLHNDIYDAINPTVTSSLHQPGKVVLITGAGRGIGRAIALQYAHAKVAAIILCARTSSDLDEVENAIQKIAPEIRVHKHTIDVTNSTAVVDLAQTISSKEQGRLDILVNNAGWNSPWTPIPSADPSAWWATLEINLKGPFNFLHAFLPMLTSTASQHSTHTNVINMTSIGAHTFLPGASAYGTSKLALLRLNEFVHQEHAAEGVVSVALHPGGVETGMSAQEEILKPFLNDSAELPGGFCTWLTSGDRKGWLGGRYVAATWDVGVLEGMKGKIEQGDLLVARMVV